LLLLFTIVARQLLLRFSEDFGDGGAFPEIHVAQYPLDMGRKTKASTAVVPLQTDSEGRVRYDAIVTRNLPGRNVKSTYQDLVPIQYNEEV
jgi:SNW domain-containing protein 1